MADNYRRKLEHYYNESGQLTQFPSKKPLRVLALLKLAEKFEPSRKYTEKEVNEIIRGAIAFNDVELLRRELYEHKLVGRLRDGSAYWLEADWAERYPEYAAGED